MSRARRRQVLAAATIAMVTALVSMPAVSNSSEPDSPRAVADDIGPGGPRPAPAELSPGDQKYLAFRDAAQDFQLPTGVDFQHVSRDAETDKSLDIVVTGSSQASATDLETQFERLAESLGYEADIEIVQAEFSDDQLTAAANEVAATLDDWAGDLASIVVRIGPDYDAQSILVESTEHSPELQQRATSTFSEDFIFETLGAEYENEANRYDDTSPWTAGNALTHAPNSIEIYCTQGFNWRRWSDNARFMGTAGHCFSRNTSVYNGNNATQRIGVTVARWYTDNGPMDFELIQPRVGSVDNSMWNVIDYQDVLRRVVSADNANDQSIIGTRVCISGARTVSEFPMSCGEISAVNQTIRFSNGEGGFYTIRNLTCVASVYDLGRGGDSGAPVFSTYTNGNIYAFGQHIGSPSEGGGDCAGIFVPVVVISATAQVSLIVS
ncbi:S1 family peptidase [Jiangella alkaliphila]|uniref:Trypsin n=1 Tax=Jiangella alkaliphila TaxID=419479 RepID=A0A1H2M0X2_9ACTN|nr:S1 family peptidase [Jiangella alkaliphila]SDU86645.1 hypothetical protein SAMN04488563_6909 [Jiangella alkaliphila]